MKRVARALEPVAQLGEVGHDEPRGRGRRRRAHVGGEIAERRVLLVPDGRDDRHGALATARTTRSSENGSRSSKLPPPRASTITSAPRPHRSPIAVAIAAGARGPCTYVSATTTFAGGKRWTMCVSTSRLAAASLPVTSPIRRGKRGSGRLRRLVEQAFACELLLQPLERREVRAEAEALDRQRFEPQLAALLVELGAAEDVDALAFGEVELECVELAALHLHRQRRAVLRVLEREEHRRPALLAPQLGHLAFDPERRQPVQPRAMPC